MTRILFNQRDYLTAVRDQFSDIMRPEQLQVVMRTAAKRVARHCGQISKYDGQGRLRQGFPAAGDTGGRVTLPNRIVTMPNEKEAHVKRRQNARKPKTGRKEFKRLFDAARKARGPSRKMFVARTDGGNGP